MSSNWTKSTVEDAGTVLEAFPTILQTDVPKGREGKHKRIITRLLAEIEKLKPGTALKVPLASLPDSKENIRSALNRATHQRGIDVATSSDSDYLYIWQTVSTP
jgi:TusA-related sulfurtransferase